MVGKELILKHSPEEIAESLYRLYLRVLPEGAARSFGQLALGEQLVWLTLARKGAEVLEQCEGMRLSEVGTRLAGLSDASSQPHLAGRIWEMLARYLLVLIDCDEAGSLKEVEDLLAGWYQKSLLTQGAAVAC